MLACVGLGLCMDYGGRGVWDSPMVTTDTLTQNDAFQHSSLSYIKCVKVLQVSSSVDWKINQSLFFNIQKPVAKESLCNLCFCAIFCYSIYNLLDINDVNNIHIIGHWLLGQEIRVHVGRRQQRHEWPQGVTGQSKIEVKLCTLDSFILTPFT